MKRSLAAVGTALALFGLLPVRAAAQAPATENLEQVRAAVLNLIRALVDQGVLTAAKAQEMLRQAGIDPSVLAAAQTTPAVPPPAGTADDTAKPVVRVPYVPEIVKDELRNEVKQEVLAQARAERWGDPGALPAWLSKLTVYGDARLRMQMDRYADNNGSPLDIDGYYQLPPGTTTVTTSTRDRMRMRVRLGVDAAMSDQVKVGVRLAAVQGAESVQNPLSYDVDLGRYGRSFGVGWNLAYLQWDSKFQTRATGGRMLNPYFTTDLVWATDLTIDGVALAWNPRFADEWSGFFTAGFHPLRQSPSSAFYNTAPDQWLHAVQGGVAWTSYDDSQARLAGALYDFVGIEGQLSPAQPQGNALNSLTAPLFRQLGNTMFNVNTVSNPAAAPVYGLASDFRLLDVMADYQFAGFDPLWLTARAEWVRNIGFDAAEIRNRIGLAFATLPQDASGLNGVQRPRINGYQVQLQAGAHQIEHWGDWQLFGGYRYLERDAVPDFLTGSEYRGGFGGTDLKSTILGANIGLTTGTSVTLRYILGKSIDGVPQFNVDSLFVDFLGRF